MAQPSTHIGSNRTGMQASPIHAQALMQLSPGTAPMNGEDLEISAIRARYNKDTEGLGSVPPPGSLKGMATTALEMLKGNKPTVLIDKLGERLAFERSGVRLYESLIVKFDALGGWDGGPTRERLMHFRDEELSHFELLKETLERLGADPTAMTPSADLTAVESMGLMKVVIDSRTTMPQALHAILIAEDADIEGWNTLIALADAIGQQSLADEFGKAEETEGEHQRTVRQWLASAVLADAQHELGSKGTR